MVTALQSRPFRFDAVRRYTMEEYYRLVEEGLLEEDARVELLDGQIVPMSLIGPRHHWIVDKLLRAFLDQEKGRFKRVTVTRRRSLSEVACHRGLFRTWRLTWRACSASADRCSRFAGWPIAARHELATLAEPFPHRISIDRCGHTSVGAPGWSAPG
jgi:Uma2 family endonuclease